MIIFLIAIVALVMGSFASCASYRLARESLLPRSKCPKCNMILRARNLIPLFSWIFQKGKCSKCHNKISIRYPLIELFFVAIFLTIYFCFEQKLDLHFALLCLIATVMMIMSIIDIERYFIPNSLQIILAVLALLLLILGGSTSVILANIGAAVFYCAFGFLLYFLFYFLSHVEAIGIDDIKFFAVAGLMLGMSNFLSFILIIGILGIIFGVIWEKVKKDNTFPFGPALCASVLINLIIDKKFDIVNFVGSILL